VELEIKSGAEALFDGFDQYDVTDTLHFNRLKTVKKKKRFGLV